MNATATGTRGDESGLLARLSLEQKVRLLTGADAWSLYADQRRRTSLDGGVGRPARACAGRRFDPRQPIVIAALSGGARRHVGRAPRADVALRARRGSALQRRRRPPGSDRQHRPDAAQRARLRMLLRGPAAHRAPRRGLRARRAGVPGSGRPPSTTSPTIPRPIAAPTTRASAEQVLRELYLPPFEACVFEADVALVMAAYNSVNGHTMTANPTLLRDLLKDEWGFQGVVVSDWSATRTTGADAHRPASTW